MRYCNGEKFTMSDTNKKVSYDEMQNVQLGACRQTSSLSKFGDREASVTSADCKSVASGIRGSNPWISTIFAPLVKLVITPPCHGGGQGFESPTVRQKFWPEENCLDWGTQELGSNESGTSPNRVHYIKSHLGRS